MNCWSLNFCKSWINVILQNEPEMEEYHEKEICTLGIGKNQSLSELFSDTAKGYPAWHIYSDVRIDRRREAVLRQGQLQAHGADPYIHCLVRSAAEAWQEWRGSLQDCIWRNVEIFRPFRHAETCEKEFLSSIDEEDRSFRLPQRFRLWLEIYMA